MSEVKKTSTNTSRKVNSKRSSGSCKVSPRPKRVATSGTGPGNKINDHKK